MSLTPLPIDGLAPQVCAAVREAPCVLVHAAPGSGKTTRIPPALMEAHAGRVLVLEPRRLAARLAAERIASERGWRVGDLVGYQVRFEDRSGPSTRLKFITEGLLLRQMLSNPLLDGVGCVVLDEFHERGIHTDTALALLRLLQRRHRPDLRIVIMSATLDAAALSHSLGEAPVLEGSGTLHTVAIEHLDRSGDGPLPLLVARALRDLYDDARSPGHVLVFLPGAAEIRAARAALAGFLEGRGGLLLELRSELPFEEQVRAFQPSERRKVILATNIAETSVTVDGVTAVIDSGLARIAGFAHWSGLPTLDVRPVSQASCDQRAGRAGRTAPGVVKRLYTKADYSRRPAFEKPEVVRSDLTQALLELHIVLQGLGGSLEELPWLDPPPLAMLESGAALLHTLGALDDRGAVTDRGRRMAALPFHPRLARMIVEGASMARAPQALLAAALISEGMLFRRGRPAPDLAQSDVGHQRDAFVALQSSRKVPHRLADLVDEGKAARIARLVRMACPSQGFRFEDTLAPLAEDELAQIVLAGFPDRVCQVRTGDRRGFGARAAEVNLCLGGGGTLSPTSAVQDSDFLVAVDADERTTDAEGSLAVQVRVASGVDPELLVLQGGAFVSEETSCRWDPKGERVRAAHRVLYGKLVLEERPLRGGDGACEEVLLAALRQQWPRPFEDDSALRSYPQRVEVVRRCGVELPFPDLAGGHLEDLQRHICEGRRSFGEIRRRSLEEYMSDLLPRESQEALRTLAPTRIVVGKNLKAVVHYEPGAPPWVASRLQDFFGTSETPAVGRGMIPLTVHLLAPNGRAVQVTSDLPSFWARVYPSVKKELSRRYPRHAWPDNPLEAAPERPGKRGASR